MKKGFTLMELLAVIIVLGVVSIITVNVVTTNIETTKKKTFEVNAIGLLDAAKEYVTKEMENNDFPEEGIEAKNLNMKNNPFISGIVRRNEQDQIMLENVTDGKYCVNGVRSNLEITEGNCVKEDDTAPTVKIKELKTTRTSTQIMIKTQDNGSGISYYEYCVNEDCKKVEKNVSKEIIKEVITINNLEPNKEYVVKVRVVNGNESEDKTKTETIKEIKVKTTELDEPTFKISSSTHATIKELIITYPSVEEGYVKKYEIYRSNKENSIEFENEPSSINNVTTIEEKLVIDSTMKVVAYIGKEENNNITKIVTNEIIISGIDPDPPKVNVLVPDIDSWTKTKTVEIVANDEGVGLALRPYSYDGGKTWVKESKKIYKTATKLDIKVRDRLGNISSEFKIGETVCTTEKPCALEKIDGERPRIEIEIVSGTKIQTAGYTDWYNSDKVRVKITIRDYYRKDGIIIAGGSGISMVRINAAGINEKLNNVPIATYDVTLTKSGNNDITVFANDAVGNVGDKYTVVKIDNVTPAISVRSDPLNLGNEDYNLINNVNTSFGPTGGQVICNPANSLKAGRYIATCSVRANNGKNGINVNFGVQHSYVAKTIPKTCKKNCKTKKVCKCGEESCDPWECPDGVEWPSAACKQYFNATCCKCDLSKETVCDEYSCPEYDCYAGGSNANCPEGTAKNICCY